MRDQGRADRLVALQVFQFKGGKGKEDWIQVTAA
jgi:hypothetical protein